MTILPIQLLSADLAECGPLSSHYDALDMNSTRTELGSHYSTFINHFSKKTLQQLHRESKETRH